MPDISQYNFSLREVGVALLKSANITEGKWALGVNFGINVGNMGQNQEEAVPSAMIQIQSLNLARVSDEAPVGNTIFDASKV
jgi:hypothetical protein